MVPTIFVRVGIKYSEYLKIGSHRWKSKANQPTTENTISSESKSANDSIAFKPVLAISSSQYSNELISIA